MAIDTENKRRSTLGILPVADGTIATADRLHIWQYSGIAAASPVRTSYPTTTIKMKQPVATTSVKIQGYGGYRGFPYTFPFHFSATDYSTRVTVKMKQPVATTTIKMKG